MALRVSSVLLGSLRSPISSLQHRSSAVVPQASSAPLIFNDKFDHNSSGVVPREAWVETLDTSRASTQVGLINLHPRVFATLPRLDIIHENVVWQQKSKAVNTAHTKLWHEVRGSSKKPWPQKGTGRARHGKIRSPLWRGGGVVHGPRAGTTQFYMLPFSKRVLGLISTLSAKFAQDDLKVVESLSLPSDEPGYLEKLCDDRLWGPSVLFVDVSDIMPRNITLASDTINHINLMPAYGVNVHSMLKHSTLVLTVDAVRHIEERLLHHLTKPDYHKCNTAKYRHV